jgi:hypothetical protein
MNINYYSHSSEKLNLATQRIKASMCKVLKRVNKIDRESVQLSDSNNDKTCGISDVNSGLLGIIKKSAGHEVNFLSEFTLVTIASTGSRLCIPLITSFIVFCSYLTGN